MTLHNVPAMRAVGLYCGPTAICAVTGRSTADVLRACHLYMKRPRSRPIVGMYDVQITSVLAMLGYRCDIDQYYNDDGLKPTFGQFMRGRSPKSGTAIVRFSEHVGAFSYDEYVCTRTDGLLVPVAQSPYLRSRVHCIIEVEPL
jgi:hypothetical protein